MTMTAEIRAEQLAELVKEVQAGNEVLLTQGSKPVARIIAASQNQVVATAPLKVRSIKGHHVLTPLIRQDELAEEMFPRE